MITEWSDTSPGAWAGTFKLLRDGGLVALDWLTAADDGVSGDERIAVMARLVGRSCPGDGGAVGRFVRTRVPLGGVLRSVVDIYPAAAWHEREVTEMFGIEFDGHPDPRPLFLGARDGSPPLLRSTPLPRRVSRAWPGHYEPSGRPARGRANPGVEPDWVRGDAACGSDSDPVSDA